jgi:hypothetical protein
MGISEERARQVLAEAKSEASDPGRFSAERRDRGWFFAWSGDPAQVPIGTGSWVVADSGRARALGFRDTADELLAKLDSPG